MNLIMNKILSLNLQELQVLEDFIQDQKSKLKVNEYMDELVPDIFKNDILDILIENNFDKENLVQETIACIEFENFECKFECYKFQSSKSDSPELDISHNINSYTPIIYDYQNYQIDNSAIDILNKLNLKNNTFNRKMLFILIHNFTVRVTDLCGYSIGLSEFNCDKINKMNKKNKSKHLWIDNINKIKFDFILFNDILETQ
ncbi:hypothetical protein QJ850_gp082 [Acanthamoeba polyphaga mimivirus]|uniref:Uncharacterized protein n=1 Tax=Acanthamoeba polyphaga mimivirus Kroon TaxID=3069720 RepID=A0A0G2Y9U4_9VIRU|nr:hypothetical protein QJ850_gp082 [Acanthamoeba polyphaga mimivirus]AKI80617.1 hypothetical protein [Acanthamoeba polyphaga mimivirus Kroon]